MIRHAAGSNDHPGMPTFLQMYKILSTFSVIKPPQYGNCTVFKNDEESTRPIVTISDIKELYNNSHHDQSSLTKLKEKLNDISNDDELNFNLFLDDDYNRPEIINCVIYQVTGYLSQHILKSVKCDVCKTAFTADITENTESTEYSPFPPALLTNIMLQRSEGRIIHPNLKLYNLIHYLENLFSKYCHRSDVYEMIIENIYTPNLSFPCKSHGDKILAQIIQYYILLRMRQYTKKINTEKKYLSQQIKKNSKFYKT
jgi:hypothetical protein